MATKKTEHRRPWGQRTLEIGAAIAAIIGTIVAVLAWRMPVQPEPNEQPTGIQIAQTAPALPATVATPTAAPPRLSEQPATKSPNDVKVEQKIGGKGNVAVGVMNGGTINNR